MRTKMIANDNENDVDDNDGKVNAVDNDNGANNDGGTATSAGKIRRTCRSIPCSKTWLTAWKLLQCAVVEERWSRWRHQAAMMQEGGR